MLGGLKTVGGVQPSNTPAIQTLVLAEREVDISVLWIASKGIDIRGQCVAFKIVTRTAFQAGEPACPNAHFPHKLSMHAVLHRKAK